MSLNLSAATARLSRMTQSTLEPALSGDDLLDLLGYAGIVDVNGRVPSHDDWVPTYSEMHLYRAASEGWLLKAAKLNGESFSADGASMSPERFRQDCMEMSERYRKKISGSVSMSGRTARRESLLMPSGTVVN